MFTLPFGVVLSYNTAMKTFRPCLLVVSGIACLVLCATAQDNKQIKRTTPHPTTAVSGKVIYGQYCAVCHGVDGRGAGPAAAALKQHPTDLTQISRQNGGQFPEDHFMKMMNGEGSTAAHGTADMPIWGTDFRNTTNNPNLAQDRIYSLMCYIEDLQAK
jgi:mono/diheme cytochrome c family protein